nr:hypothetical protein [Armatimonadota bacterium]
VTGAGSNDFTGTIHVDPPAGWTVLPASIVAPPAFDVSRRPVNFQLHPPATIPTGRTAIPLRLQDKNGKIVDQAVAVVDVPAPVQLTPEGPKTLNADDQPLSISVKNITDKPLSGSVTLSTGGAGTVAEPNKPFGPLAPGAAASVDFMAHGLKLIGSRVSLLYTAQANGLSVTARQDFALRGWLIIGPYASPNGTGGFDTVYDPEKGFNASATSTVINGQTAHWVPAVNDSRSFVDLIPYFNPHESVLAYAHVYVKSPTARGAIVSAGSDDGIKGWLNGKVVVSDNASRGAAPGQDEAPVQLKAGWNEILLKITQGGYGWGFYFDLLDTNHNPMPDLVYAAQPG